ncbi:MAG: hypothetical protein AB8G18_19010 [Gammaproteobacteria bacterium]
MTTPTPISTSAQLVSQLAVVVSLFVLLGLLVAGAIAFQFIADPESNVGFAFLFVTSWLLILGVIAVVIGAVGMKMARGASVERRRNWYCIALGLVALAMGATFGVGFV